MIDLSRTRTGLLSEIGARSPAAAPLLEITDPRVTTGDALVRLRGGSLESLFPILEVALSERFAPLPRPQLIRGLLMPLRHALGNAGKHGNAGNPAKTISVELVLTGRGTLVAVTDEGPDFDFERTFRRFLSRENYFAFQGDGFRNLHAAAGAVAFEDGGRTLLLCFLPSLCGEEDEVYSCAQLPPVVNTSDERVAFHLTLGRSMGQQDVQSCHFFPARALAGDECGLRVVLPAPHASGQSAPFKILTGRCHTQPDAAFVDFQAANLLYGACRHVRVPRPLAHLPSDPHFILYDFHPWMNLWQYLDFWRSLDSLRHAAHRTGRALAGLHRSSAPLPDAPAGNIAHQLERLVSRAAHEPAPLPWQLDFAQRLARTVATLLRHGAPRRPRPAAPIHGSLGWDCINFGVDKHFYFQRFEHPCRGDPGLDLGGFAADLLCFALARHDRATFWHCRDEFLESYNARAEHPISLEELNLYVAWTLAARIQAADSRTRPTVWRLLEALDAVCHSPEEDACPP